MQTVHWHIIYFLTRNTSCFVLQASENFLCISVVVPSCDTKMFVLLIWTAPCLNFVSSQWILFKYYPFVRKSSHTSLRSHSQWKPSSVKAFTKVFVWTFMLVWLMIIALFTVFGEQEWIILRCISPIDNNSVCCSRWLFVSFESFFLLEGISHRVFTLTA